ncbi:serine protease easter [Bactrocera dorsalis]|uniref:CLIP domain-containing serine protease n=1 Tax=Bactrocera dorsalis TaxID=27457 RepID=A0A6J0RLM2_BACDO|nr:serine protease easter [Bactrocera dorsalis]
MGIRLNIYIFLVIMTTLRLHFVTAATSGDSCLTPSAMPGSCINLEECRYLYELVLDPNLSQNDRRYLRSSQCGYKNGKVLICCPPNYRKLSATTTPRPAPADTAMVFPESVALKTTATTTSSRVNIKANNSQLLPNFPQCGNMLENRIYGGTETAIDEFPWLALFEYTNRNGGKGFHCGGVLINDRYVLTAAHCVFDKDIPFGWRLTSIRLGEWDTRTDPDCTADGCAPKYRSNSIERITTHPGYGKHNDPNDIALVRLTASVPFSDYIKPICLPRSPSLRNATFLNYVMDAAGWGKTEKTNNNPVKLKTTIKIKDFSGCVDKYSVLYNIPLESSQLCAGGDGGSDTCSGDSGGPLMFQDIVNGKPVYFAAGIVSFGPSLCGVADWPAIYTRVGAFIDWIESNIEP